MSNTHKQPTIQRGPARRAQGLDEDVTALPRPVADELDLAAAGEQDLSVDPDDLGTRFLSDAVEQGDFNPAQRFAADSSLSEVPAGDQPLSGSNFIAGNSVWEQTVDLESRTQGASDQLRDRSSEVDAGPQLSLLDREGDEGDDTIAPELDLDEQGSHTRRAASMPPEPQLDADSPPRTTGMRPKAQLKAAARSALDRGAGLLRRVADRLHRYGT